MGDAGVPGTRAEGLGPDDVLGAADSLLGPYYEAAFVSFLRLARGESGAPPLDVPTELRPFVKFKPRQAATQAGVRKALRRVLAESADLASSVAAAFAGEAPSVAGLSRAVETGNDAALSRIASVAAARRHSGWAAIVLAAATGWQGRRAGAAQAMTELVADSESALEEGIRERERLEKRLADALRATEDKDGELDRIRGDRRGLREQIEGLEARVGAAEDGRRRAAETVAAREDALGARAREADSAAVDARGRLAAAEERVRRLEAEVEAVRASRLPDLTSVADALEAQAASLRSLMDGLRTPGEATAEPAGESPPAPREARRGVRRTRRVRYPPGLAPDTVDGVRWVLGRRGFLVLVDGYNVTRQSVRGWGELPGDAQRELLLTRCRGAARPGGARLHVVFDSAEPEQFVGRRRVEPVTFEFSGGPKADDRLVEIAERAEPGTGVLTVTSDRELRQRLERVGAVTARSETFLEAIGAPRR